MRYRELILNALEEGRLAGIDPLDVELLVCHAFAISRSRFRTIGPEEVQDKTSLRRFRRQLRRLLRKEPLDYIRNEREFFSRSFRVDRSVLIPRPETEILVEQALARIRPRDSLLDIGAGSGCVSITLALEASVKVTAVEISRRARRLMNHNINRYRIGQLVEVSAADLFPRQAGPWHLIVSNPPYLSRQEWHRLPPHIRLHEPRRALVAGKNGTEILLRIVKDSFPRLRPGGWLLLETGAGQAGQIAAAMKSRGFCDLEIAMDLAGIERVVMGRR